jgi:hypothetical protein
MNNTKEFSYFCPKCGSPSLEISQLAGGDASCKACKWKGQREDLAAMPIQHTMGSPEQILSAFTGEMMTMLAKFAATPIISMLNKWGFLSDANDQENLKKLAARYMKSIGIAATKAVFEERETIEKEKVRGRN